MVRLMTGAAGLLMALSITVATACGPSDLGIGEECTDHDDCSSGYCNLDASGNGQCDTNDFGAPCSDNDDCDGICQAAVSSAGDATGYCTRRCDNIQDCSAEPGWFCSGLGPGSDDLCRRE